MNFQPLRKTHATLLEKPNGERKSKSAAAMASADKTGSH